MENREEHRRAFDLMMEHLKQSVFLSARAAHQHKSNDKASGLNNIFESALDRYADIFGKAGLNQQNLSHLLESAIYGEAHLRYEYEHTAGTLDNNDPYKEQYTQQAARHAERITEFINTSRRTLDLTVSPHAPFVMPYRGIYINPYSDEIRIRLVNEREYFMRWNEGVVAIIRDDDIDEYRKIAETVCLLFYDADELMDMGFKLTQAELEAQFTEHLSFAKDSEHGTGEPFAHHINRSLLKHTVLLRTMHPLLKEGHEAAYKYSAPLVEEMTQQLLTKLQEYPSWAPETFSEESDCIALLAEVEQKILDHSKKWALEAQKVDHAGLLFQFKGISEMDHILHQVNEL